MLDFKGKKITVMGLGLYEHGSGIEAAKFFISRGAEVIITDLRSASVLRPQITRINDFVKKYLPKGATKPIFHLGEHHEADFKTRDYVVKNPGVKSNSPFLALAAQNGAEIITDIILFFNLCQAKIVGVTGTRGKSTTSSLIAAILKYGGKKVWFGGNNTISPLTFLEKVKKDDCVVLELSSWALEGLKKIKMSPRIAVVTNIYPDHLNTYNSLHDYIVAKKNIFKYQDKSGVLILNKHDIETKKMASEARGKVIWFDKIKIAGSKLSGEHNEANIAAATTVAKLFHIPNTKIVQVVKKFKGLAGRLELVRSSGGIKWYNDTTATSPDGTRAALKTFYDKKKKIILIAGGVDKNLPYEGFGRKIASSAKVVLLLPGTATEKIKPEMPHFIEVKNMAHAVRAAKLTAVKGDIVLLSPGAASFGLFQNEFDRGEQFVKLVRKI